MSQKGDNQCIDSSGGSDSSQQVPSLTILGFAGATLTPAFSPEVFVYTASVASSVTDVTLTAVGDPAFSLAVNGQPLGSGTVTEVLSLVEGANDLTVSVTSDGNTRTYSVTITRASVPALDGLSLSNGTLAPQFASGTLSYSAEVGFLATEIAVTPSTAVPGATILVNNAPVASGQSSDPIALVSGNNDVVVQVATSEGEVQNYTITLVRQTPAQFGEQAYVKASNTGSLDEFCRSIALSGDTLVVGAWGEDSDTSGINPPSNDLSNDVGAVYVFIREGTTWSQQAFLKASNAGFDDGFGHSVALDGDTLVVGAPYEDGEGATFAPDGGAAYVFTRSGTTWTEQALLKASNPGLSDFFGWSVDVHGDTVAVGAIRERSSSTGINSVPNDDAQFSGAAYVFTRDGATWTEQAYIKAFNTGEEDQFGYSVALFGDRLVVGAPFEDGNSTGINSPSNENGSDVGAAYVFARNGATWSQEAYVKGSNVLDGDRFGWSVALSPDTVAVGAPFHNQGIAGVYLFARSAGMWSEQQFLPPFGGGLGYSVALDGDQLAIGVPFENFNRGVAVVFARDGNMWMQQTNYFTNPALDVDDRLGWSIALSGDTVAVGVINEDSNSTGINSVANELAADSGAVYVFR